MVINRSQLSNKSATANYDPRPQNIAFGNFYRALKFWLVFESWTVAVALAWGTTVKLLEVPLSALTIIYHTNNWLLRFPCFLSLSLSLSLVLFTYNGFLRQLFAKKEEVVVTQLAEMDLSHSIRYTFKCVDYWEEAQIRPASLFFSLSLSCFLSL